MEFKEYTIKKGFTTSSRLIEESQAERDGSPIHYDESLVGYFLKDGYGYVGVPFHNKKSRGTISKALLWRVGYTVTYLNQDRSIEDLVDFVIKYVDYFFKVDGFRIDKTEITNIIDECIDKLDLSKITVEKKYFWTANLSLKEKQSIVMSNMKDRESTKTVKIIENAIDAISEEGERFITAKEIKKMTDTIEDSDISEKTISRHIPDLRKQIDDYNSVVFGTNNFQTYRKTLSVHRILDAVKILDKEGERLSRRKVAKEAELHFNTVQNLWMEDEIQEELNKYNLVHND